MKSSGIKNENRRIVSTVRRRVRAQMSEELEAGTEDVIGGRSNARMERALCALVFLPLI